MKNVVCILVISLFVLFDHDDKTTSWETRHRRRHTNWMCDFPGLAICKEGDIGAKILESGDREIEFLRLVGSIDSTDVPRRARTSRHDYRLGWIA